MEKLILVCSIAYLAGSVNFAVIFFKLTGKGDPRTRFSGNAGTTNAYRQAGFWWAALIFLLDIGRAMAVAALAVYWLSPSYISWACFFLVLGNSLPCFHRFHGGKGVANYLGFSLYIFPLSAALSAAVWLAVYGAGRIPFIASFFMTFILSCMQGWFFNWAFSAAAGAYTTLLLIVFNHRKNIIEFWQGKKLNQSR